MSDIKGAVKSLQDYWTTYDKQQGYADYRMETLIDDALYGLGIAIDKEKYQYGQGFDKFKRFLRAYLNEPQQS